MSAEATYYMSRALDLAREGLGRTAPNPTVGCVIVKDGKVIAQARTADGGRPHAEALALEQAGAAAEGADIYVTLEPCFHTHADRACCAARLIAAKPARVIIGCRDRNPEIEGRGIAALQGVGIAVVEGVMEAECAELNHGFFLSRTTGRPWVTLKIATSLDSKIATASRSSKWITGDISRRSVHELRGRHDAILTGIGTVLADDPALTIRESENVHFLRKIVLDGSLRIDKNRRIFADNGGEDVWVFTSPEKGGQALSGAKIIVSELSPQGKISIPFVLKTLAEAGTTRLMVEAGQGVLTAFLTSGLWDELHLYRAPVLIGGDGVDAFGALGVQELNGAPRLLLVSRAACGDDLLEIYRPQ